MENPTDIYIVTAYKYGEVNSHSYVVTASTSLDRAIAAANSHTEDRGGKYACTIRRVPDGEDPLDMPTVHYVPSLHRESQLDFNEHVHAHHILGAHVAGLIEDGKSCTFESLVDRYRSMFLTTDTMKEKS